MRATPTSDEVAPPAAARPIEAVLDLMESTSEIKRQNLRDIYLSQFGDAIVPHCIARFRRVRRAPIRSDLVRFLIRYARDSEEVVDFGLEALTDRSKHVRESACALLAYSGKPRALSPLEAFASKSTPEDAEVACRAIDAIEHGDHNRFYPDYTRWIVTKDDPSWLTRESVDHYFGKFAPQLMDPLRRIFGDPYAKWTPR